ncbi:hypothetical protein OAE83_00955 [bacterium]|nr:hypothetical protein [bacterium]
MKYKIGMRIGKRTITGREYVESKDKTCWVLECDCGKAITPTKMKDVGIKCVQCLDEEKARGNPLYGTWNSIKSRIFNPEHPSYKYYGGGGKEMYAPWISSFTSFAIWINDNLGNKPRGKSLDRINNELGYLPHQDDGSPQLRWATDKQQRENQRKKRRGGMGMWKCGPHEGSLHAICNQLGIDYGNIYGRIYRQTKKVNPEEVKSAIEAILRDRHCKDDVVLIG